MHQVPPHGTRHYIVAFEKPEPLARFDVGVDVLRDATWRLQFERRDDTWENSGNRVLREYWARG